MDLANTTVPQSPERPGRISLDDMFMTVAETVAKRGTCNRLQVGAVAVKDGRIVCIGYNGSPPGLPHCTEVGCGGGVPDVEFIVPDAPPGEYLARAIVGEKFPNGCTRAVHAEANMIAYAAKKGISLEDATVYLTDSPCLPCSQLLVSVGACRIVYRTPYRIRSGLEFLEQANVRVVQHGSGRGD